MVGDFSAEKMLADIENIFGKWTQGQPSTLPSGELPRVRGRHVYLVHLPGSVQTQVLVGFHAITRKHPDWQRLGLANCIYGGAFNSRLVMNIREQKGYTYSPRSTAHPLRQHGYFTIHAAVRNDVVAATLTEMFYEMDRLRSLPVPPDELSDATSYLSGVFSLGLGTQEGLLSQLATVYLNQLPENYLETYRERVRAMTPQDVLSASRKYFDSANAQIVIVGDRKEVEEQAGLFGDIEVYDAHGNRDS
jgi:predicted Zn-dependent peptidase